MKARQRQIIETPVFYRRLHGKEQVLSASTQTSANIPKLAELLRTDSRLVLPLS